MTSKSSISKQCLHLNIIKVFFFLIFSQIAKPSERSSTKVLSQFKASTSNTAVKWSIFASVLFSILPIIFYLFSQQKKCTCIYIYPII